MGMNVGSSSGDDEVVSTINTTPLVDVMLVLLIIFLITVPVVTQSIAVNLPKETNQVRVTKPENIEISVSKDGDVYWGTKAGSRHGGAREAPRQGSSQEPAARGAHPRRRQVSL